MEKSINGAITKYIYDNEDILFEYNNAGVLEARYTHGPGVDEPLSMERAGQLYYYHADGLGSVAAITDASGDKMLEFPDYKSFGLSATAMHAEFIQPYAFTGRELDQDTGLYYYRNRYYDANTGRFISKDPIGFNAGDVNLYRYVGNNPVNWVDPWGLEGTGGPWHPLAGLKVHCTSFDSCSELSNAYLMRRFYI
ncbi:MAG: RHS repeat-associated core domain-containing protein [Dissulfurispiraceae bacterium]|nr:RHS repeat-associated core domain-containing protein [Dissulfurispiraceae bacterium]